MFEVTRSIEYKGYVIQERRITSPVGGVVHAPCGGSQIIPPVAVSSTQWRIVKCTADGGEEEIALAWSEEDAQRQIDNLVG